MKGYWVIDNENQHFETLTKAKWHCDVAYTPKERLMYLRNCLICHIVKDEVVSYVEIRVTDEGKLLFSRVFNNKL